MSRSGLRRRPDTLIAVREYVAGCMTVLSMAIPGIAVQPVDKSNSESTVRFLIEWVSDGETEAGKYLANHAEPDGAGLIARRGPDVIGYVAIVWEASRRY